MMAMALLDIGVFRTENKTTNPKSPVLGRKLERKKKLGRSGGWTNKFLPHFPTFLAHKI